VTSSALEALLAKQEITEAIHRYCRAMDRIDDELGYGVWHADGTGDYGGMYQGSGRGFVDFVHQAHQGFRAHAHRVGNVVIELDGDKAASETYVEATFVIPAGEAGQRIARSAGRYLDRWSRRDGRWAIDHRRYIHEWDEGFVEGASMNARTARRDRTDESYGFIGAGAAAGTGDDEAKIRRTLALYGTLLDDRRFDDWGELFTEDAEWTIPGTTFVGRDRIVAGVGAMEPPRPGWVKHLCYPAVVQVDSPASARAWSDLVAVVRDEAGAWSIAAVGRYYDDLENRDGAWRFRRRRADIDTASHPLPGLAPVPKL
jgi:hypothetical protein